MSPPQHGAGPRVPCVYEVAVCHRRRAPVAHSFRHRSYLWLFDLEHPPRPPRWLRPLVGSHRAADHVDVRALLDEAGIDARRILVLANLRVLGYVFNPISVYWCYDGADALVAHVAEVHNTYGDRHAYLLPVDPGAGRAGGEAMAAKAMRVSPFHATDGCYRIHIGSPGETVSVAVSLERPGDPAFRATLSGRRHEATAAAVARLLLRYPAAPLRGRALIQLEGLRLWARGMEVRPR